MTATAIAFALSHTRRAAVAVWVAMLAPVLTTALALGMEVTNWSVVQIDLQRAADASSVAGALNFKATSNGQTAATAAARMAQLNGAQGTTTPTWNSATNTLSDNMITTQVTTGVKYSSDTAIKVTIQQAVPLTVSKLFDSGSSVTVTATSEAELLASTSGGSGGGQPCLVALSTSGSITGSGSTYVTMPNCTIRSNGTIGVHGGGGLTTGGIYAGGAISIDAWIPTTPTPVPNDGTITDPYASDTALQTALTTAAGLTGSPTTISCNGSPGGCAVPSNSSCTGNYTTLVCTLRPGTTPYGLNVSSTQANLTFNAGTYGPITLSGGPNTITFNSGTYEFIGGLNFTAGPNTVTFNPGLYLVNGPVSLTGNTSVTGSNVTLVMTGAFTENSVGMTLSAPSTAAVASTGGVAGVALAGSTSGTVQVAGSTTFNITGVIYFPNAVFNASGSSGLGTSSTSCLEILGASIELSGSSYFNSSCTSVNATAFSSLPGTYTASVVR